MARGSIANKVWQNEWKSMPEFIPEGDGLYRDLMVKFKSPEDIIRFAEITGTTITDKTKSIWYPPVVRGEYKDKRYVSNCELRNKYPIYIISKGRWDNMLTSKALDRLGVDHKIVVEEQEYDRYADKVDRVKHPNRLLILPKAYLDMYETCDDLGSSKSKGPGAARNFCWDHSILFEGAKRHWVMDDNLEDFYRYNRDHRVRLRTPVFFRAAEDFVDQFTNVPVAGLNYRFLCSPRVSRPAFILNRRIYSCLLLDNTAKYRWRGRYNEDTDLSLRVLKDGFCTINFNAFLCGKIVTQAMDGGNTREFYEHEGTLPKSEMLKNMHPDVARVVNRYGRDHHEVDYSPFETNKLIRVEGSEDISTDYGFYMININEVSGYE